MRQLPRYFFLQEIDELLSGGLTDEDEEDIMNELAELEKLELPSVPDTEIVGSNDAEEELPDVPTSEPGMSDLLFIYSKMFFSRIGDPGGDNYGLGQICKVTFQSLTNLIANFTFLFTNKLSIKFEIFSYA